MIWNFEETISCPVPRPTKGKGTWSKLKMAQEAGGNLQCFGEHQNIKTTIVHPMTLSHVIVRQKINRLLRVLWITNGHPPTEWIEVSANVYTRPISEVLRLFQTFFFLIPKRYKTLISKLESSNFSLLVIALQPLCESPMESHPKWMYPGTLSHPPSSYQCLQNDSPYGFSLSLGNNQKWQGSRLGLSGRWGAVLMLFSVKTKLYYLASFQIGFTFWVLSTNSSAVTKCFIMVSFGLLCFTPYQSQWVI